MMKIYHNFFLIQKKTIHFFNVKIDPQLFVLCFAQNIKTSFTWFCAKASAIGGV